MFCISAGLALPADLGGSFRPDDSGAYFRGDRFAAVARDHRMMADTSLEAWTNLSAAD